MQALNHARPRKVEMKVGKKPNPVEQSVTIQQMTANTKAVLKVPVPLKGK